MLNNRLIKIVLGSFLLSAFIFAGVEEELKKINQKLDNINSRLSNLEKKVSGSSGNKKQVQADPNKVYNIPIDEDTVVLGNPDAKLTIPKFTDFQWPFCAKSISSVDAVLKKYPNDVKLVIKNYPLGFHKQAKKAARYALAAHKQGRYKDMYRMIFCGTTEDVEPDKCKAYGILRNNENIPLEYAQKLGLDMNKFIQDMESPEIAAQLKEEMEQFKNAKFPKESVPKFLLQGKEVRWPSIMKSVEEELAKIKSNSPGN